MTTVTDPKSPEPVQHRHDDALMGQKEWLRVALDSIGDAVITVDPTGHVTSLNAGAESLTGWKSDEAAGVPLAEVFKIADDVTHRPVEGPAERALREGVVVGLANHTLLVVKDGTERLIGDSAAPIRNPAGVIVGVVLGFRDIAGRRRRERSVIKGWISAGATSKPADRARKAVLARRQRSPDAIGRREIRRCVPCS